MDETLILKLVKQRLGITSDIRNEYLGEIIKGVLYELDNSQGIKLDEDNNEHLMFVVDYSCFRYQSVDMTGNSKYSDGRMPRDIQWRLHNLFIKGH